MHRHWCRATPIESLGCYTLRPSHLLWPYYFQLCGWMYSMLSKPKHMGIAQDTVLTGVLSTGQKFARWKGEYISNHMNKLNQRSCIDSDSNQSIIIQIFLTVLFNAFNSCWAELERKEWWLFTQMKFQGKVTEIIGNGLKNWQKLILVELFTTNPCSL